MRYMGGKGRIAKQLSEVILSDSKDNSGTYWEPFVGGGGMGSRMGNHFEISNYSDIQEDLILMWKALNEGWEPPTEVSYDLYQELRYTEEPSALRGLVGFGGSFGGRFFEGYARGGNNADGSPRNHQAESARAVLKDIVGMRAKKSTNFSCVDVFSVYPSRGDVVYCDPPYQDTKNYSRTDSFDHVKFWETIQSWSESGSLVYVSEYQAPEDWKEIWSKPLKSSVRVGSEDRHTATEKLFKFEG